MCQGKLEDCAMKKIPLILILACICFITSFGIAYSSVDVLLKISGIEGESRIDGHENEIDVLSWSWQMSSTNTIENSLNRGDTLPPVINPVTVVKYVDKASPDLALSLLKGTTIDKAVLFVRKAGESPLDYLIITMDGVRIVNVYNGGESGQDRLHESVTMDFLKVCYQYTPQKEDGSADAPAQVCWDRETNSDY